MHPTRNSLLALGLMLSLGSVAFAQVKPAPPKEPAAPTKEERAQLLQTVGLLTASQVYQAYLNIGFMADGRASGSYEDKELQQIMESVVNLLDASDKMLDKVARFDIDKADKDGIEHLRKLSGLVRQQAEELQAFWKTGDKKNGEKYDKLRQEAWDGISKLLGLDKETGK